MLTGVRKTVSLSVRLDASRIEKGAVVSMKNSMNPLVSYCVKCFNQEKVGGGGQWWVDLS